LIEVPILTHRGGEVKRIPKDRQQKQS